MTGTPPPDIALHLALRALTPHCATTTTPAPLKPPSPAQPARAFSHSSPPPAHNTRWRKSYGSTFAPPHAPAAAALLDGLVRDLRRLR